MAGPKLTKEKRSELRKEIGEQVAAKTKLAGIVKTLSEKYGIGANAVRWHHKRVVGAAAAIRPQVAKSSLPKESTTKVKVQRAASIGKRGRPTSFRSLAAALRKFSPEDLRRAIKAGKLQAKHDVLFAQAPKLRDQLSATERRAHALQRQIDRLVSD